MNRGTRAKIFALLVLGMSCTVRGHGVLDLELEVELENNNNSTEAVEIPARSPALERISNSGLKFSNRLYKILRDLDQTNLVYSPLPLLTALASLKVASDGDTLTEINGATNLNKLNNSFVQEGFMELLSLLKSDENATIKMVNRIFTTSQFKVDGNFAKTIRDKFSGDVNSIDFSNTTIAAEVINSLISNYTNGTIQEFITEDSLESLTRVVLLNSLYFKAEWDREFTPLMTDKRTFITENGTEVEVDMMNRGGDYPYAEIVELNSTALSIPYKGGRYSLTIILPERGIPISQLERNLESFPMHAVLSRMTKRYIQLSVPKFRLESNIDMIGPLQMLGIKTLLSPLSANLTKVSRKMGLYVNSVIQRAQLSVTEGGTETASSNFIEAVPVSPRFLTPFEADRPFITFVYDNLTDTVLFVGRKLN